MAIVFISPKKRQKAFIFWIVGLFLVFMIFVTFTVLTAEPGEVPEEFVFNEPKVNINFGVLNSGQFKNLEPFLELKPEFYYEARSKDNKVVNGKVSADSLVDASKILSDSGLTVIKITKVEGGRDNPFVPYSQSSTQKTR